jgi:Uncharacterized conserved protein
MKKTIVLVAALDTKGEVSEYLKGKIEQGGYDVIAVDFGTGWVCCTEGTGDPIFTPDISRDEVARAAGGTIQDLLSLPEIGREGKVAEMMSRGAIKIVQELYNSGKLDGILSLGGSQGTNLGTRIMRSLPFGVPKVVLSTLASGDISPYIGTKDIAMIPSTSDLIGLNRVTEAALTAAAGAIMGMVAVAKPTPSEKPLIAISTLGTCAISAVCAKKALEERGYEVVIFHAFGGGRAMEEMIEQGLIAGIFDLEIMEVANNIYGTPYQAGPSRLEAAGKKGIPQVVVPGYTDMIGTYGDKLPPGFKTEGRKVWEHSPIVWGVSLAKEEKIELGRIIAQKLNKAIGPTAVLIPQKGVSFADQEGSSWYDPEGNQALAEALRQNLKPGIIFEQINAHILDEVFPLRGAALLHEMMQKSPSI